jgi:hypothetical protein
MVNHIKDGDLAWNGVQKHLAEVLEPLHPDQDGDSWAKVFLSLENNKT